MSSAKILAIYKPIKSLMLIPTRLVMGHRLRNGIEKRYINTLHSFHKSPLQNTSDILLNRTGNGALDKKEA